MQRNNNFLIHYNNAAVQQPKRVDFFYILLQAKVHDLSAGTESSTIGASIGPPPRILVSSEKYCILLFFGGK